MDSDPASRFSVIGWILWKYPSYKSSLGRVPGCHLPWLSAPLVVKAAACPGCASHTVHKIKALLPWAPHPQSPQEQPSPASSAPGECPAGDGTQLGMLERKTKIIAEEREIERSETKAQREDGREGTNAGSGARREPLQELTTIP